MAIASTFLAQRRTLCGRNLTLFGNVQLQRNLYDTTAQALWQTAQPLRQPTLIRRTGTTEIAAFRQHLRSRPTKALRFLVPRTRFA